MRRCRDYCGVACIDGTCPKANREEYIERDYPVVNNCRGCHFYRGCEDCYFGGRQDGDPLKCDKEVRE